MNNQKDLTLVPINVLHVDDDGSFLEVSKPILLEEGSFQVDAASSVEEAYKKMQAKSYDAIISDYEMPKKDGLQFLKELREREDHVPFIVFTGRGREEVAIRALNLGADGYINKQGNPETVYGELSHAIKMAVERKRAQKAVLQAKEDWEHTFDSVPDFLAILDEKNKIVRINKAMAKQLGVTPNEAIGRYCYECVHGLNGPPDFCPHVKTIADEEEHTAEVEEARLGGEFLVSTSPLRDMQGNMIGTIHVARNITELKKAEKALCFNERQWATTVKSIGDAVITTDVKGNIVFMNKIAEDLTGWQFSKVANLPLRKVFRIINEDTRKKAKNPVVRVINTGHIIGLSNHTLLIKKDGTEIPIDDSGAPIFDDDGKITGTVLIFRDVTKERTLQRELSASEQKYRLLFSEMNEGVCLHRVIYDESGKAVDYQVLDANHAYETITGISRKQAIGQKASVLYGTQPAPYLDIYAKVAESGRSTVFETYFPPMKIHFRILVYSPEKGRFATVFFDITKSKKAEEELRRGVCELEALLEGARTVLKNQDFEKTARAIFDSCKKLIGASAGYIALLSENGKENEVLFLDSGGQECTVDPSLPMPIRGLREIAYKTRKVAYENSFLTSAWNELPPKGHTVLTNVLFAPLIINDKAVGVMGLANKPSEFTERDAKIAAAFGEFAAIALNNSLAMTAIKNNEQEVADALAKLSASNLKLEAANEKLQVIGSLTRHDVRNKLMVASSNLYLLKKRIGDQPELRNYLAAVETAIKQSTDLFTFGRLYERIGAEKQVETDVATCFGEATSLLSDLNKIEIVNDAKGLRVMADSMLSQLFYNFIDNSLKHGEKTSKIRLYYRMSNKSIKLIYEDNGVGIPLSDKSKIFSDGFTTGGSGLGLKLVKKLIESYGWSIKEKGIPAKGVKFEITIPRNRRQTK